MKTQTQKNEIGQKVRHHHSGHIAKIIQRAKESTIATANATEDFRQTGEVETLVKAAKTCRQKIDDLVARIAARHDEAIAFRKDGNSSEYDNALHRVGEIAQELQTTETAFKTVIEKLLHTEHEQAAKRDSLIAEGNWYRARGCNYRLGLIKAALLKPKKVPVRVTRTLAEKLASALRS